MLEHHDSERAKKVFACALAKAAVQDWRVISCTNLRSSPT